MTKTILLVLIIFSLSIYQNSCDGKEGKLKSKFNLGNDNSLLGPRTEKVEKSRYHAIFYIADIKGSDENG